MTFHRPLWLIIWLYTAATASWSNYLYPLTPVISPLCSCYLPLRSRWASDRGPSWPARPISLTETKATRASSLPTPPSSSTSSCWAWNETNPRPVLFLCCVSNPQQITVCWTLVFLLVLAGTVDHIVLKARPRRGGVWECWSTSHCNKLPTFIWRDEFN